MPEVVRSGLHNQTVDADAFGLHVDNAEGQKIFACGIGLDNGADQVLWHLRVVRQKLFGVFGQAVPAVPEAGVVVVRTYAWIEADTFDDLFGVDVVGQGVAVEFIEISNAHGKVGVGEQFDRLGLSRAGQQDGGGFVDRAL